MNLELVARIAALERRLDGLVLPDKGWVPHFLTTPYTNTSFDGDSFSDVAANTVIENTSWSTAIPANAKALLIYAACRDSGSAATSGLYVTIYGAAAAIREAIYLSPSAKANDDLTAQTVVVPCTNGDVWYKVNASGADTMDIWLRCFGWWE